MGVPQVYRLDGDEATRSAFVTSAWWLLRDLVADGAALGWVDPPGRDEVAELLESIATGIDDGDACLVAAGEQDVGGRLAAFGYWQRYERPTHRPHADIRRVAVAPDLQGRGLGHRVTVELVAAAMTAGIEVLTLDARGDNSSAIDLYRSLGFVEYGRLPRFAAFGDDRYDMVLMALDLR